MKSPREWAETLTGEYGGWMCPPGGEWEDLLGVVKIQCSPEDEKSLAVTITSIEFGRWTGRMDLEQGLLEGSTHEGDDYFRCLLRERATGNDVRYSFHGGIYERPEKLLFELHLDLDPRQPARSG